MLSFQIWNTNWGLLALHFTATVWLNSYATVAIDFFYYYKNNQTTVIPHQWSSIIKWELFTSNYNGRRKLKFMVI